MHLCSVVLELRVEIVTLTKRPAERPKARPAEQPAEPDQLARDVRSPERERDKNGEHQRASRERAARERFTTLVSLADVRAAALQEAWLQAFRVLPFREVRPVERLDER